MKETFSSLTELLSKVSEDKEWDGVNSSTLNRYPVRFILFDNFSEFYQFIDNMPAQVFLQGVDKWLDEDSDDCLITYSELAERIKEYIEQVPSNDFIIAPFSELARFYDNTKYRQFDSLISSIRLIESSESSQARHQRIYIPIIGMQRKLGRFFEDPNIHVWELTNSSDSNGYTLILTKGSTYGISGLQDHYSLAKNMRQWLRLWQGGKNVRDKIICSSSAVYFNSENAQPDNAFTYIKCKNPFDFLTKGLGLDFGTNVEPSEDEMPYWEQLAQVIDVNDFDFDQFVKERLDTFTLHSGYDFIKSWFDCATDFDRWLLTLYFRKVSNGEGYVYRAVSQCASLSKSDLFSEIATLIFDDVNKDASISERKQAMMLAAEKGVKITDLARQKIKAKLKAIATSPEQGGYYQAVKLLTPLTPEEHQLAIEWVAKGKTDAESIKDVFPGLYHYLEPLSLNSLDSSTQWITDYFDAYRRSKIADQISSEVSDTIAEKNANTTTFHGWLDNFKTVKTVLHNRRDIDVIYWIDGLGVDWIPFIRNIISRYAKEHVYLNEVYVAAAALPTVTSINKEKLQALLPEGETLQKKGDIDAFAHTSKSYPQYIIDEMAKVEQAISQVLEDYNGKKIAFVSDHGLTYLSQLESGLKIGGLKSDHEGRLATYTGTIVDDNKYIKLDNGKTVCSLTHHSLVDKVDKGHGAHGGCTPEEVLVPIIIVSSQKNANNYSVKIENDEIDGTMPVVCFVIKGLSSIDIPTLVYNDVTYQLIAKGNNIFESERLNLVDTATQVKVCINGELFEKFSIKVSTGATEDDLFDF